MPLSWMPVIRKTETGDPTRASKKRPSILSDLLLIMMLFALLLWCLISYATKLKLFFKCSRSRFFQALPCLIDHHAAPWGLLKPIARPRILPMASRATSLHWPRACPWNPAFHPWTHHISTAKHPPKNAPILTATGKNLHTYRNLRLSKKKPVKIGVFEDF